MSGQHVDGNAMPHTVGYQALLADEGLKRKVPQTLIPKLLGSTTDAQHRPAKSQPATDGEGKIISSMTY